MVEVNNLLDEHLEHIGEALEQSPGTYAVRAETALECSADLALVVYVEECQQRINQQQAYADEKAFDSNG